MKFDQLNTDLSAEFGGPSIGAWPMLRGEKIRPHKGGDGGAGEARRQEEDRQARVNAAVKTINDVFNGAPTRRGVDAATAYDPNAIYYDERGNVWSPKNTRVTAAGKVRGVDPARGEAEHLIGAGELYTGVETIPQAKTRDQLYAEHKGAVYDLNKRDVEKQFAEAERQNRFGLARSGLAGGSVDVDSNAQLQEKTNEGLMRATGIADQAAADLKTQDERTRQSLIGMAQSGIDTGTASQMAMRQLDANAQTAAGQRAGATVGNLFGDLSNAYLMRQYQQGLSARSPYAQQYQNLRTGGGDSGSINNYT